MRDQGYPDRQAFLRVNQRPTLPWGPIQAILVALTLVATLALN
ncbi:MAG: hypothetical protein R3E87_14575 [Burkholderiaceae bacterium]